MPFDQSDWELASDYTMNTTFEQSTQPSSPHDGDLWFDTSDGNHQYRYSNQTWVDVQDEAIETASTAASEAKQVAEATNQHFWSDTNGVHVTEVEQTDWSDPESPGYHNGANVLLNSQGQLFRVGMDELLRIQRIAGYSGGGGTIEFDPSGADRGYIQGYDGHIMVSQIDGDVALMSEPGTYSQIGFGDVRVNLDHDDESTLTVKNVYAGNRYGLSEVDRMGVFSARKLVATPHPVFGVSGTKAIEVRNLLDQTVFDVDWTGKVNGIDPNAITISKSSGSPQYISASTSAPSAASATGWHVERLREYGGTMNVVRASGVIHATGVSITTAIGGMYRSGNYYIPLPETAKGILSVTGLGFGSAMGGSSVAGMGCILGGNAAGWQYSSTNSIVYLTVMFTNPASSSSRNIYQPIEVLFIV